MQPARTESTALVMIHVQPPQVKSREVAAIRYGLSFHATQGLRDIWYLAQVGHVPAPFLAQLVPVTGVTFV